MRAARINVAVSTAALFTVLSGVLAQDQGSLPVESSLTMDPLVGLLGCLRDDKPGFCFQKRALGYFESWMTSSEDEDADTFDSEGETERLPSGISPQWGKIIDQVAERISSSYGSDEEDEDDDDQKSKSNDTNLQNRSSTGVEGHGVNAMFAPILTVTIVIVSAFTSRIIGRGKYKKDKKVKVAMTVILLIIYFIINQLFYMFDKVARTFIFAKLILALKIFVVVKLLELKRYLWWVKEEKKEVETHSELALHDHHYDEHGAPDYYGPHEHYGPPHHDHGWGWHSRSGPDAHAQAYNGQMPGSAPLPPYPLYTPDPPNKSYRKR